MRERSSAEKGGKIAHYLFESFEIYIYYSPEEVNILVKQFYIWAKKSLIGQKSKANTI